MYRIISQDTENFPLPPESAGAIVGLATTLLRIRHFGFRDFSPFWILAFGILAFGILTGTRFNVIRIQLKIQ